MKIKELLEAAPEWIKHPTVKGVMIKNPRWEPPMNPPRVKSGLNRSEAMKARHAEYNRKLDKLYQFVWREVGETFPDGDPHDASIPYARRLFGLDEWGDGMALVDKAVRKHGDYKSLTDWLASMWDDYAADTMHDARNGHVEHNSPFYRVGDNGEIEPEDNPWR